MPIPPVVEIPTPPEPATPIPFCCPFHNVILDSGKTDNGWCYFKCPIIACRFFCSADDVVEWVGTLSKILHPSYKEIPTQDLQISLPFAFFCTGEGFHNLKLRRSKTSKNPNRFLLSCSKIKCKAFMWLDAPIPKKVLERWQQMVSNKMA